MRPNHPITHTGRARGESVSVSRAPASTRHHHHNYHHHHHPKSLPSSDSSYLSHHQISRKPTTDMGFCDDRLVWVRDRSTLWVKVTCFGPFLAALCSTRRSLVELLGDEVTEEDSIHWETCFDALANHLFREFAGRIRGFGRSSRQFVVKNFLALPGRIRVEETRLLIVFTSSPLNAVVHMSRLDDPVEEVDWLGGRRIEFEPYGL